MKMFNYEMEMFVSFLFNEEVPAKDSRMRTRFMSLVAEHKKLIDSERIALAKQFSYKDAEGEAQTIDNEDGSTVFNLKDEEAFQKEYNILMNEEFIIQETEDKVEMLNSVRNIVFNTDKKFKGEEAFLYERYCEIAES